MMLGNLCCHRSNGELVLCLVLAVGRTPIQDCRTSFVKVVMLPAVSTYAVANGAGSAALVRFSMDRLHLKLFYLRTRIKREPQGTTARLLGVRPATMSHLEQGRSLPTLPMLIALCRHYDVSPTYLLDDTRPIQPEDLDRWSERTALIGCGSWVEVGADDVTHTGDGQLLFPVREGARFFDETGARRRASCTTDSEARKLEQSMGQEMAQKDHELANSLERELLAQRKPRGPGSLTRA